MASETAFRRRDCIACAESSASCVALEAGAESNRRRFRMHLVTPPSPRGAAISRPCRRRAEARSDITRLLSLLAEFVDDTATPWADRLEQAMRVLLPIQSLSLEAHSQTDRIDSTHSRSELEFRSPLTSDGRHFALRVVPCCGYEPDAWDRQFLAQVAALSAVVLDHTSGVSVRGARRATTRPRRSLAESMLVGSSPMMQKLREQIERFAATRFTVLIQGEAGTGKDIVARLIHGRSPRSTGPFVVVNCAALVDSLLDAEFFGIVDPQVTEIMVNGSGPVFIERDGRLELVVGVRLREQSLQVAVRNMARALGDDISEEKPLLDSRLPDGSRVAAVFSPCSLGGTTLTIRKFQSRQFTVEELVRVGTLTTEMVMRVHQAMDRRENILISGGTSTGKTTVLNALSAHLPPDDRVIVIEDTAELQLQKPNLVRFEARREQPGVPAVTIRELLRGTLRHRPDRIIVGEVRGGEAFDLLQALNTGHSGTLSTIHANSAQQALARFTTCVLQSGVDLPYQAIRHQIADSLHLLLHLERQGKRRLATELVRLRGYDAERDRYQLEASVK